MILSELDLEFSDLAEIWYLLSSINLTQTPNTPWNETTKTQYIRPRDRTESDLTNEKWGLVEPFLPPPAKRGAPHDRFSDDSQRDQVHARYRVPVADISLCFLPVTTVRNYFYTWRNDGGYDRMMNRLRVFGRELAGRSETQTAAAINIQSGCQ